VTVSLSLHNVVRVTANVAISGLPGRVWAILLNGGSAASSIKLTNDADGSGTAVTNILALASQSVFVDFTSLGGVDFSSKIYATIAGLGAEAFIWYD